MYRQYELRSNDRRLTCWLRRDAPIKKGSLVTLKGYPDVWWEVIYVGEQILESPPDRHWQVGGLL